MVTMTRPARQPHRPAVVPHLREVPPPPRPIVQEWDPSRVSQETLDALAASHAADAAYRARLRRRVVAVLTLGIVR